MKARGLRNYVPLPPMPILNSMAIWRWQSGDVLPLKSPQGLRHHAACNNRSKTDDVCKRAIRMLLLDPAVDLQGGSDEYSANRRSKP
jgi:hypothetical protein